MSLRPVILVLNERYRPPPYSEAAWVGASSFFSSLVEAFLDWKVLAGIVYYRRDEDREGASYTVDENVLDPGSKEFMVVATVVFNFRMSDDEITSTFRELFSCITKLRTNKQDSSSLIVYYQTDTLLHYHPRDIPFCVTHHGPLVLDFVGRFSEPDAIEAFGGLEKTLFLMKQQMRGTKRLREDVTGLVLVHSKLQQQILERAGVQKTQCFSLSPPIESQEVLPECLAPHIDEVVRKTKIVLFTAVARLDFFKNVRLVVETGLRLIELGISVHILIAGDPRDREVDRALLWQKIPSRHHNKFMIIPKLAKCELYALMNSVREKGIFVCPSRYETLGITPLEAARNGVATLINDSDNVEAASYFPGIYRVNLDTIEITARIQKFLNEGVSKYAQLLKAHMDREMAKGKFRESLHNTWREISRIS